MKNKYILIRVFACFQIENAKIFFLNMYNVSYGVKITFGLLSPWIYKHKFFNC